MSKTRILLLINNEIKHFFFINSHNDGSIYFGTSTPKPKEAFFDKIVLEPHKRKNIICDELTPVAPEIMKYSYHQSHRSDKAHIHLRNSIGKYLYQFETRKLHEIDDYLFLCTILPSNPLMLPTFLKEKGENDIVFPIDYFNGKPFCCEIILIKNDYDYKHILQKKSCFQVLGACSGLGCNLIINLFTKESFIKWPAYTTIIVSENGKSINIEKNAF